MVNYLTGLVDYNKFSSANLILSIKKKCNITIHAGEPIMQVLPFFNLNGGISAGYGPTDDYQDDRLNSILSSTKQFYRKYVQIKKTMKLTSDEHAGAKKE